MPRWLALVLVLASCAPVATPASPTPTASPEAPTPIAAPTPTALQTPSAAPSWACGDRAAGPLPVGWVCVESARHDLDGDGWADTFVILVLPAALVYGPDAWRARAVLSTGQTDELAFSAEPADSRSMIRGFVDADRDGRDDILVELRRGASTEIVSFFGIGRNGLAQASYQDGTKAQLIFAGSMRHGAAVECRSRAGRAELVLRSISNYKADDQWDWTESVYTWSSMVLVPNGQRSGTIKVAHPFEPPPDEDLYWSFRCFGMDLY